MYVIQINIFSSYGHILKFICILSFILLLADKPLDCVLRIGEVLMDLRKDTRKLLRLSEYQFFA